MYHKSNWIGTEYNLIFVLNMNGLVLIITGISIHENRFAQNEILFGLNMTGLVLNMIIFVLCVTAFVLNITGFFLNMSIYIRSEERR